MKEAQKIGSAVIETRLAALGFFKLMLIQDSDDAYVCHKQFFLGYDQKAYSQTLINFTLGMG